MTTYTAIPNADIDQDSPVTQPLMTALRDNPIAITEGATGAPRIVAAAIEGGASSTDGQVYYSEGDGTGLWGNAENIEATKDLTGTDGYVKLPGGVIMQWGQFTSASSGGVTSVTFPVAFTTSCFFVYASLVEPTSTDGVNTDSVLRSSNTTSASFSTVNNKLFQWFAIGY